MTRFVRPKTLYKGQILWYEIEIGLHTDWLMCEVLDFNIEKKKVEIVFAASTHICFWVDLDKLSEKMTAPGIIKVPT